MKKIVSAILVMSLLLSSLVLTFNVFAESNNTEEGDVDTLRKWSWNQNTGKLVIDYEGYLSQHDLVYNAIPYDGELEGMPVANGSTGAQIWQDGGIRMQINSVDNAPHSSFGAAQVLLATSPALDDSAGFEQRLNLYDGYVTVKQNNGFNAEIFGVPNSEILGIHVIDSRDDVESVSFDIEMWVSDDDIIKGSGTEDITAWKTVNYFENDGVVGFTKGISEKEPFGYAFAVTVDGADFEIIKIDDLTARVSINMPENGEYTVWMNSSSRSHIERDNIVGAYEEETVYTSTAQDIFDKAYAEINEVKEGGYNNAIKASCEFWHDFWQRSFVHYDNGNDAESDYIENFYYLSLYQIGGAAYAEYQPLHFINGVYTACKDKDIHWSKGYWHFNQRAVYNALVASNHIDGYQSYLEFYNRIIDTMTAYTVYCFNETVNENHGFIAEGVTDAMFTAETIRWDGFGGSLDLKGEAANDIYSSEHVRLMFSTGIEIAENMYNAYAYTMNEDMLEDYYEYIRRTVRFITEWAEKDENGVYQINYSNALENWWKVNNAVQSNAGIRSLIPKFLDAAKVLGLEDRDRELIDKAKDVLENLEPLPTVIENGETIFAPYDLEDDYSERWPDGVVKKNRQQPELEIVYPHDLIGVDSNPELLAMILGNYNSRSKNTTGVDIWCVDGIQQARLGLGNDADEQLGKMINLKQKRASGLTDDGNGKLEAMGLNISTVNEMLLQSYDSVIRVFPAVPDGFDGAFTLLAKGGFLVSSECEDGVTSYIGIKSQNGGMATVSIPWADATSVIVNGKSVSVENGRIGFDTDEGGIYLIQPASDASAEYDTVAFTAEPNFAPKEAFDKTLGISKSSKRTGKTNVYITFDDSAEDGVFNDISKNNNANIVGNVERVESNYGYAASFDGTNGYVRIEHSETFDPMENFVLSFDMKTTVETGNMCLFDKYGTSHAFYVDIYNNNLRVIIDEKVTSVPIGDGNYPLCDGEWHTVKITVNTDSSLLSISFDGKLQKTDTITPSFIASTEQEGRIGLNRNNKYPYIGEIDNFMITDMPKSSNLYYDFDDAVQDGFFDDTRGGYDAIINGSIGSVVNGDGYAVSFDGNGGYLEVEEIQSLGALENFVVSFDIKSNGTSGIMCLFDKYGNEKSFYSDVSRDNMRIFVNDKVTNIPIGGTGYNLLDGNWHNVKIMVDTDNALLTVYFDGQIQATDTVRGGLVMSTEQHMRIGLNRKGYEAFVGLMDNFEIKPIPNTKPYEFEYDFDSVKDGEFVDTVGGYTTATTGSISTEVNGNGYAAVFTGKGNYLDVVGSDSFGALSNFILSFDMKSTSKSSMALIDKYGSENAFYVDIYNNNLRVFINNKSANFSLSNYDICDGEWHNVKIKVDTDNALLTVYFDNQVQGTSTISGTEVYATSQKLRIGTTRKGYDPYIGLLDNLSISTICGESDGISLNKTAITVPKGANDRLVATAVSYGKYTTDLIWETSDASIVTVNRVGRITAVSKGEAVITVKTADGSLSASCKVIVTCTHSLSDYISDGEGNHYRVCVVEGCEYQTKKSSCVGTGATCTSENVCSVCGFVIAEADGHKYNEYGYCSVCEVKFIGAYVRVGQDLSLIYIVNLIDKTLLGDGEELAVKFTKAGKEAGIVKADKIVDGEYTFTLTRIAPQQMTDKLDAELMIVSGNNVKKTIASHSNYSVKENLESLLEEYDEDQKLVRLVKDILAYGGAAQIFTNYNLNDMADANITDASTAVPESTDKTCTVHSSDGENYFKSASVFFDTCNRISIKFTATVGARLIVKRNDVTVSEIEVTNAGDNTYFTEGISATCFADIYTFELYSSEGTLIQTVTYSINSYCYSMKDNKNEEMKKLAIALYNYGVSSKIYGT